MDKQGYIYIVSNPHRTTLYIGVCSNLLKRIAEHKDHKGSEFAKKYNCTALLYYEKYPDIEQAIQREKQLKKWKRAWKESLIREMNPEMKDLYDGLSGVI